MRVDRSRCDLRQRNGKPFPQLRCQRSTYLSGLEKYPLKRGAVSRLLQRSIASLVPCQSRHHHLDLCSLSNRVYSMSSRAAYILSQSPGTADFQLVNHVFQTSNYVCHRTHLDGYRVAPSPPAAIFGVFGKTFVCGAWTEMSLI